VAKNRAQIEASANTQSVADLTLNEAAALLAMSSEVKKLFAFLRGIDGQDPETVLQIALGRDIALIRDNGYDPFYGRSEEQKREWMLFSLFLAKRGRYPLGDADNHVEYLLQGSEQLWPNVDDWLGDAGEGWRRRCQYRNPKMAPTVANDFLVREHVIAIVMR
jgi:hypothetical protein